MPAGIGLGNDTPQRFGNMYPLQQCLRLKVGVLHQRENLNPKNFVGEEHCEEHRQRPGV